MVKSLLENGPGRLAAALAITVGSASFADAQNAAPVDSGVGELDAEVRAEEALEAAAAESAPGFSWVLAAEVANDFTFDADDTEAELNDLYPTLEAGGTLTLPGGLSLNALAVLESVLDPEEDRAFEDLGVYAEELYAAWEIAGISFAAGKLPAPFGVAWDAPGIYAGELSGDYELVEQLGVVVSAPLDFAPGAPTLSLAAVTADRTVLSDSLGTSRGRVRLSDGGAGNTDLPENLTLTLDGEAADTVWTLSLRRLAGGDGDPEDEFGAGFALTREEIDLGAELELGLLGEAVWLANAGGGTEDALYGSLGAELSRGPWSLSGGYEVRDTEDATTDHAATATLGWEFAESAEIGLGYRYIREENEDAHTLGVVVAVEFGGTF